MEPEHFTFRGKRVKQAILDRIWEETKLELVSKYPVDNVEMPLTIAMVLNYKNFRKAVKKLLSSPHIEDTSEMEYGAKTTVLPSAGLFFADTAQTWVILKCSGYGYSLEYDLKHELLHIWEAILGLKWGTLAQMEEKTRKRRPKREPDVETIGEVEKTISKKKVNTKGGNNVTGKIGGKSTGEGEAKACKGN